MMQRPKILIILILVLPYTAMALNVPVLQGRINDKAGLLSPGAAQQLNDYLAAVERTTGAQIALLTIPALDGEVLEYYSLKVAEAWKLGAAGQDNGILLLVALAEKQIRIEVGYGLEESVTDAMSSYIIREVIVPEFKNGDFEAGILAGFKTIGGIVTGDAPLKTQQIEKAAQKEDQGGIPVFFLFMILFVILGRIGRYRRYRRRGMSPMGAFFLGSMLGGSTRRSNTGGGGFGGGGFSGGGGGFGGGGASGGW